MKTIKQIFFICCMLLSFNTTAQRVSIDKAGSFFPTNTFSQPVTSIYTGLGFGTNIGGVFGIGSEIKYKMVSFNFAIGCMYREHFLDFPYYSDFWQTLWLGYDFGVKLHSDFGLFFGVNYGIIGASKYYTEEDRSQNHPQYESVNGLSFTLGYRRSIYKNFYVQYYVGLTSKKEYNYMEVPILDAKYIYPRIGLIFGYEFNKRRNKQ